MPLPPNTHIGYVHLKVRHLARMADFYIEKIGLRIARASHQEIHLSASGEMPPILTLTHVPQATLPPRRSTGLYHLAIRLPDRKALARTFRHLVEQEVHFQGFSDHIVSEAIYLADPEGNGVELYADRPRAQWPVHNGQIEMATRALDVRSLLAEVADNPSEYPGIDPDADMGHVHLKVSSLHRAEAFYHGILGMRITQRTYPGALFFAAGDYHHHIGTNIWLSAGAPPPPATATGLDTFSVVIPDPNGWWEVFERLRTHQRPIEAWIESEHSLGLRTHDLDHIGIDITMPRTPRAEACLEDARKQTVTDTET